jgi:NodT family efflux transporter outer membrane factor (OMF) lipoprotein
MRATRFKFMVSAALAGASLLTLAACASVPKLGPKAVEKPVASYATTQSFAAPASEWAADRWWDAYGDAQLSKLIDEAIANSPTLAQAKARLETADAQVMQSRAARLPTLSANGQFDETEVSRAQGFPPFIAELLPKGYIPNGRLTLDASYDLDLFGKNRAALASSVSEDAAARADLAQARLTLATAVAQAYGDLARLAAERDAAAESLRNRTETSKLTADRLKNGLDTRAELFQSLSATPTSKADVESLDEQILIARHRIAALLGEGPDRGLDITLPGPEQVKPFGLPPNLTANLLGRRPDIVAAKLRAQAAAKRIDVAKAAFMPDISLSGYIGQQAFPIGQMFTPFSPIGQIGPAISLPLFEGGKLRAGYRGARADYDNAVDAYNQTVVTALQDVADAAASVQSADRQLNERREALKAGEAGYAIAQLRYKGGLSTYVDVLSAENAVIAQRRAFADAQARVFTLDIALTRALGGGFTAS